MRFSRASDRIRTERIISQPVLDCPVEIFNADGTTEICKAVAPYQSIVRLET